MDVVVACHDSAREHDTGHMHPERPERVDAVLRGISDTGLDVVEIDSPEISMEDLLLVHDQDYVEAIEKFCSDGGGALDMDTFASTATWKAALTAAGGVRAAIAALEGLDDATGFVVARPPGHHALRNKAMGFCFFNNVAISAAALRKSGARVAILDWDVHHGNGTQSMMSEDPGVLYASVHQKGFYPFEGQIEDIDMSPAEGTTLNVPLPAGTGGEVIRKAWDEIVVPAVAEFSPDWLLISAGYDGHASDPLADFRMLSDDYGWIAKSVSEVHPVNRTVTVLEGGYDLDALRESVERTLLGFAGEADGETLGSPASSVEALEAARRGAAAHWNL